MFLTAEMLLCEHSSRLSIPCEWKKAPVFFDGDSYSFSLSLSRNTLSSSHTLSLSLLCMCVSWTYILHTSNIFSSLRNTHTHTHGRKRISIGLSIYILFSFVSNSLYLSLSLPRSLHLAMLRWEPDLGTIYKMMDVCMAWYLYIYWF